MLVDASIPESQSIDLQPQSKIWSVINEPGFCLQTALLWIRSGRASSSPESDDKTSVNEENRTDSTLPILNSQLPKHITTTTQPELGLLSLHLDRILAGADAVGWHDVQNLLSPRDAGLEVLRKAIQTHIETLPILIEKILEPRKVRVTVDRAGHIDVQSTAITSTGSAFIPKSLDMGESNSPHARVHLDTQATQPSIFTGHKTTFRPFYDDARRRAKITPLPPTEAEVLLHNQADEVMEASLCTVYFLRDGKWVTPATRCGGNVGVSRRLALESGICEEGVVNVKSLNVGEYVWLSNAARGFFLGRIASDT